MATLLRLRVKYDFQNNTGFFLCPMTRCCYNLLPLIMFMLFVVCMTVMISIYSCFPPSPLLLIVKRLCRLIYYIMTLTTDTLPGMREEQKGTEGF